MIALALLLLHQILFFIAGQNTVKADNHCICDKVVVRKELKLTFVLCKWWSGWYLYQRPHLLYILKTQSQVNGPQIAHQLEGGVLTINKQISGVVLTMPATYHCQHLCIRAIQADPTLSSLEQFKEHISLNLNSSYHGIVT